MATWWRGDYADIRETIRRTGRLEVSETLVVSAHDNPWGGAHTSDRTLIEADARDGWPLRATLKQRRAHRRDHRLRKEMLARQSAYETAREERAKEEAARLAVYHKQMEEQRKRLEKAQAEQEKARAAREAKARAEREAIAAEKARLDVVVRQARAHVASETQRQNAEMQAYVDQAHALNMATRTESQPSPVLMALLFTPQYMLNDDQKVIIAGELERLFLARGAGPLRVVQHRQGEAAVMTPRELALAKHEWYRVNLTELGTKYPPRLM